LVKQGSCELCLIEDIKKYEDGYLSKEMTKNYIIDKLQIDNYKWYKHINYHVRPLMLTSVNETAPELARDYIDKMGDLLQLLEAEKVKAQEITESISAGSDPKMINAWVSVNAEIRRTIESIARLDGDLKTHTEITKNTINIEYGKVIEHVLQETCMTCKAKLSKSLPDIIKLSK